MNDISFTIGAEVGDERDVVVQLRSKGTRGATGADVAGKRAIGLYLSSDADGLVPEIGSVLVTDGGEGALLDIGGSVQAGWFLTNASGRLDVAVSTDADVADTLYLNAILPSGKVVTSSVLTFIDNP